MWPRRSPQFSGIHHPVLGFSFPQRKWRIAKFVTPRFAGAVVSLRFILTLGMLPIAGFSAACHTEKFNLTEKEAIQLGVATIQQHHPAADRYQAKLEDGVWAVYPDVSPDLGGGWSATVDDQTGEVTQVFFGERSTLLD